MEIDHRWWSRNKSGLSVASFFFISLCLFHSEMNGITGLLITVPPRLSMLSGSVKGNLAFLITSPVLTLFTHMFNVYFPFVCLSACVWQKEQQLHKCMCVQVDRCECYCCWNSPTWILSAICGSTAFAWSQEITVFVTTAALSSSCCKQSWMYVSRIHKSLAEIK